MRLEDDLASGIVVPTALAGMRLDRAVALLTDLSRSEAGRLVDEGAVFLAGRPVTDRSRRLREADRLSVDSGRLGEAASSPPPPVALEPVPFEVVYEDSELIVVDKPAGVVVHPGAGHRLDPLVAGLLARYPELADLPGEGAGEPERPGIVHRLDKDTSGLLVVARTASSYRSLVAQLKRRSMGRRYLAVVVGHLESLAGVVDAPIGRSPEDPTVMAVSGAGREARTAYRVLRRACEPLEATVIEATLETGRTHQIRVHLAAIGHPVLGDRRYGGARGVMALRRPMLHAARLELEHPATGERLGFEAEPPEDLGEVLASLS